MDGVNNFSCICVAGYTGITCATGRSNYASICRGVSY